MSYQAAILPLEIPVGFKTLGKHLEDQEWSSPKFSGQHSAQLHAGKIRAGPRERPCGSVKC